MAHPRPVTGKGCEARVCNPTCVEEDYVTEHTEPTGDPATDQVVKLLREHDQSEIAYRIGWHQTDVDRCFRRLEAAGIVRIKVEVIDRRLAFIEVAHAAADWYRICSGSLGDREHGEVRAAGDRLEQALESVGISWAS